MVQIIPENRKRTSSEKLLAGLDAAMPGIQSFLDKNESLRAQGMQNQATQSLGIDPNLSPEMQKLLMQYQLMGQLEGQKGQNQLSLLDQKQQFQQQEAASKLQGEQQQKALPFMNALETIKEMRSLGQKGNLGRGSSLYALAGGQTAKDKGKYEQLGKSLISFASNIPIRNKAEFETLAEDLFDSSLPDSAREGILEAMEEIIKRNMSQYSMEDQNQSQNLNQSQQVPSARSFDRRFQ